MWFIWEGNEKKKIWLKARFNLRFQTIKMKSRKKLLRNFESNIKFLKNKLEEKSGFSSSFLLLSDD